MGGGIWNDHATLTINNCVLEGNGTLNFGGGIYNDGSDGSATLIIIHSTFSFNFSPDGGGIYNDGQEGDAALTIINSALINNISTNGDPPYDLGFAGGIDNEYGTVMISNSTISDNMASNWGGGIFTAGHS